MKLPEGRKKRVRLGLILVALVVAYLLVRDHLPEIDLQEILDDVAQGLGDWTYLLVGALAFLETGAFVGLVAPGETFVILAGAVAGVGETSVLVTIAIVWFSAWAGDSASFLLGQRLGRGFVLRHGARVRITEERFAQVERYFANHGGKTILIGRFIGLVRALAPFIAGSSGMRYRDFVPFSILGTGLWSGFFTLVGYFAAESLDTAGELAGRGTLLAATTIGLIIAIVYVARYLRDERNREKLVAYAEQRRWLRPLLGLARWVSPHARFVGRRLTPGSLGLELTTLLATAAVGLFVCFGYAAIVSDDPGPTPGDETATTVAEDLSSPFFTDLNKAVTKLGAGYVALPLAALGSLILFTRRRYAEALVPLAMIPILLFGVPELKDLVGRPRPPGPLVEADGQSFPSGHAAYAAVWAWAALSLAFRIRPGLAFHTALITAGILLCAAIALTRVYLRVHYFSDAAGGVGFGVGMFALCGVVALVVSHLRQNPQAEPTPSSPPTDATDRRDPS